MAKRTITLSDRPPVSIEEGDWTVIAKASDSSHDGQVECQANRKSSWSIRVREHNGNGKVIVSAVYDYSSNWQNSRNYSAKHGELIVATTPSPHAPDGRLWVDPGEIVAAIKRVCERMAECECADDDAVLWRTLCDECIADLPAEDM